jgi:predicted RNase H-like nuclease (RuvC/YqgF family)
MGKIADIVSTWSVGQEQRRQMLAFDSEFENTKAQRDRLKAQNDDLRSQVEPLKKKVERLKECIKEETARAERAEKLAKFKAQKHADSVNAKVEEQKLTDQEEEILKLIAYCKLEKTRGPQTIQVAQRLKVNEIRATVLLRGLRERRYVWYIDSPYDGGWKLAEDGEQYLVDRGIL